MLTIDFILACLGTMLSMLALAIFGILIVISIDMLISIVATSMRDDDEEWMDDEWD